MEMFAASREIAKRPKLTVVEGAKPPPFKFRRLVLEKKEEPPQGGIKRAGDQPHVEATPQDQPPLGDRPGVREFVREQSEAIGEKPRPEVKFHPSDKKARPKAPPTIEDKRRALEELADKRKTDPLEQIPVDFTHSLHA
jgi:hypothetical protein